MVTLRTFSKIYGLAGLRIGYGVAPGPVIEVMNRIRQPFNVNALAQVGALAALDDDEHVARTREVNREGMAYLRDGFARLGLEYVPSSANFILVRVGQGARSTRRCCAGASSCGRWTCTAFPSTCASRSACRRRTQRFVAALEARAARGAMSAALRAR